MRFAQRFLAVLLGVFWLGTASAQTELPPEPGIEAVIGAQIEAFLKGDVGEAFGYASPLIQGLFGNPENFGRMVRQGYPMVWRPGDVQYLELREIDGALSQKVLIRDQAGSVHVLEYEMVETGDGWRINGVQILQAPDVSA